MQPLPAYGFSAAHPIGGFPLPFFGGFTLRKFGGARLLVTISFFVILLSFWVLLFLRSPSFGCPFILELACHFAFSLPFSLTISVRRSGVGEGFLERNLFI